MQLNETISKLMSFISNDKLQHFVFGIAIYSIIIPFGVIPAMLVTLFIAGMKEYMDSRGFGTMSRADIIATQAGAVFLFVWYWLIDHLQMYLKDTTLF